MGRLEKIEKLNKILGDLQGINKEIFDFAKEEKPSSFRARLLDYVNLLTKIIHSFAMTLMEESFSRYRADKIDREFEEIVYCKCAVQVFDNAEDLANGICSKCKKPIKRTVDYE